MRSIVQPQQMSYNQYPVQSPPQQQFYRNPVQRPQMNLSSSRPLKVPPQQQYSFQQQVQIPQPYRPQQNSFIQPQLSYATPQSSFVQPQQSFVQPQQSYAPYSQQQQVYQQSTPFQPVLAQQQGVNPSQIQSSFRPPAPQSQFIPNRAPVSQSGSQTFIHSSPARGYSNYPVQQHQSTPNRVNYPQTQIKQQPQIQQQYIQQHLQISQQKQVPIYNKPPVMQDQQYQIQNLQGSQDLEQKFDEAINKTKLIVSKYQKPEEKQPNGQQEQETQQYYDGNTEETLDDLALQYEDGYIYRGQGIEPSTRQGYGILCDQLDNKVYSGFWWDNQYHGQGVLVNFQAEQIEGPFDYSDLNIIENGWIGFEGGFNEGKMTGKGVLTLTNGEQFDGTFDDGTIDGEGTFHTLDGQIVRGIWKDGALEQQFQ